MTCEVAGLPALADCTGATAATPSRRLRRSMRERLARSMHAVTASG